MQTIKIVDLPYEANVELLFERLLDMPEAIWLDSGKPRSLSGRFDIISASPLKILVTRDGHSTLTAADGSLISRSDDDPYVLASRLLEEMGSAPAEYANQPFAGGIMGFWGYDLNNQIEHLPVRSGTVTDLPDMRLGQYAWSLVTNHSSQKTSLLFHPLCPDVLRKDVEHRLSGSFHPPESCFKPFELKAPFKAEDNQQTYLQRIDQIKDYIKAGDCYQVNYSQHFSAEFSGHPWAAYKLLRRALPSPFSAYMHWGDQAVMSLSPERFLKVSMGQVETRPIKGTILRGTTVQEDNDNAVQLLNCAKNRAENLMIVDLLRNDLGKACSPGSIRVPKLFALESFPNVHHLVSTVTGTLAAGETPLSLLQGCFPGGSITGAPKKRAMEIIEELESCRRSLYCGSLGYVSCTGRMDTNICIRTVLADGNKLHCWGGGGIVADSIPEQEYQESVNKIKVLMDSLNNKHKA